MNAPDLLADLRVRGVRIVAEDGKIVIDAPLGIISTADRAGLVELKPALLDLLRAQEASAVATKPDAPAPRADSPWPPRPAELANWPIPMRRRWGERANALEDLGHVWRDAERIAFAEIEVELEAITHA